MPFNSKSEIDIKEHSPLALAFVGDAVLEMLVRARLVERSRLKINELNARKIKFVSAKGQFEALLAIQEYLSEEENSIIKRGRNASKASVAKNATPEEYRASTALETLFGYLYLKNEHERIKQLFEYIWEHIYIEN